MYNVTCFHPSFHTLSRVCTNGSDQAGGVADLCPSWLSPHLCPTASPLPGTLPTTIICIQFTMQMCITFPCLTGGRGVKDGQSREALPSEQTCQEEQDAASCQHRRVCSKQELKEWLGPRLMVSPDTFLQPGGRLEKEN